MGTAHIDLTELEKKKKPSPVTSVQVCNWTLETRLILNSTELRRSMKVLIGNILHQHAETCGMCSTFFPPIDLTGKKNSVEEASASGQTNSWNAVQAAGEALTALWVTEPPSAQFCYWTEREPSLPPKPPDIRLVRHLQFICKLQTDLHRPPRPPDCGHFLPPPFTAMPGMAAVFTQARSGKLRIPHPHGMCITGREKKRAAGFLGECFFLLEKKAKRSSQQHTGSVDGLLG